MAVGAEGSLYSEVTNPSCEGNDWSDDCRWCHCTVQENKENNISVGPQLTIRGPKQKFNTKGCNKHDQDNTDVFCSESDVIKAD